MAHDKRTEIGDADLDALFAEARADGPGPELMSRVLSDAEAVQAELARAPDRSQPARPGGWLAGLIAGLGGWSAVSGITAAGVVGLAVGLYSPDTVTAWLGEGALPFSTGSYDLTPDIGALWTETGDV